MHAQRAIFFEQFHYVFNYKLNTSNVVANTLNWKSLLLTTLHIEILGFEELKNQYDPNGDFTDIWQKCISHELARDYNIKEGYLFKGT